MRRHTRIRRHLVKYFVPHKTNAYKPHFLRGETVAVVAIVIVGLFGGSLVMEQFVSTSSSPQVAAVIKRFLDKHGIPVSVSAC